MFISTVLPKILAFLNAQGIGMHTAVSETTPHTFGRGDAYSLMQCVAHHHRIESTIVAKVPTQDTSY